MIDANRLSLVLKKANQGPPFGFDEREAFYKLKQAILEAYGTRDGEDVQRIIKKCWRCKEGIYVSRGYFYDDWDVGDGEVCVKCNGSSIYDLSYIRLERWRLGKCVFHRPLQRSASPPGKVTIDGVIPKVYGRMTMPCQRVLAMVFQPQYYLYLDQFKMGCDDLKRFKLALAFLLGFSPHKWQVKAMQFGEIVAAVQKLECAAFPF